jgi:hypothetical protein
MGLFRALKRLFPTEPVHDARLLDVVVQCSRCGEVIRSQISLYDELSLVDPGQEGTYFWRKGLSGSGENRCFQRVVVEYTFDASRNVIDRQIEGGRFVDEGV